ncbi:MAG: mechanosensitive ion channel family protein [Deltaproteobacteria bacterium]|nr:mechanosensitive ion channel family protein [Deltaproteobacteria bacterium]
MDRRRKHYVALFIVVTFGMWIIASCTALGQTETPERTSQTTEKAKASSPAKGVPIKEKKIDKAGEAVVKSINRFEQKASSYLGAWITFRVFAGITWLKLIICFFFLLLVVVAVRAVQWLIHSRLKKIPPQEEAFSWTRVFLESLSKPLALFLWVYGIYWALSPLFVHFRTPEGTNLVHSVAQKAADIGGAVAIIWFIYQLVQVIDLRIKKWADLTESTIDDTMAPLIGKTLRIFIVIIGGVLIVQNLTGINIGPLVASLGIGGLAVALAARESIANFFGALTILFDKPFQAGERVIVDNYDGVVESVGFRSTRVRLLTGHQVTIPNEKAVNSTIENIGRRPHIRWLTNIGITYDTPTEKVEKAVNIIEEILENHEGMDGEFPPRIYFNGFNDYSLNIMIIAWYHPPNYWSYQAWLQRTCFQIMRRFETEGIEFAFPTQTVHLGDSEELQLRLQASQAMNSSAPVS